MNLICPHCQKTISVADNLAGQTTNCPLCQGPFTVPMPPRPATPPPPPAVSETPVTSAYTPSPAVEFTPPPPPPPPPGDYRRRVALMLQPRIVRWIAPVCFVLIFFLMFFPWVGLYYGSYTQARQLGVGVAFGVYDGPQGKDSLDGDQKPGVEPFAILFFLVILAAVLASAGLVVLTFAPHVFPPHIVQMVTPWRSLAVAGLSLFALLFLLPLVVFRMSLESKVLAQAEKVKEAAFKSAEAKEKDKEGEKPAARGNPEKEFGIVKNALQRRFYFRLVVLLTFVAVLGALADVWLEKRPGQPLPRALVEW
jgi:hypothetical protein